MTTDELHPVLRIAVLRAQLEAAHDQIAELRAELARERGQTPAKLGAALSLVLRTGAEVVIRQPMEETALAAD